MRFVLAIAAFIVAAAMIVLGIAQRTVFLAPANVTLSMTVPGNGPFTVIDPSALISHKGNQTVSVRGSGTVYMSYGRTADMEAWLGDQSFTRIGFDEKTEELTSEVIAGVNEFEASDSADPTADAVDAAKPNPAGSDLWLEEFSGDNAITTTINVPEGISVLVASDGTDPAPKNVRISWPLDNSTPWAGPLIAGGALILLVGLLLYLWAIIHMRRSRGPRRNLPKGPRMPKLPRAPRPKTIKQSEITGGGRRRSIGRSSRIAFLPVLAISGLVLSGCSADFWPSFQATSTVSSIPSPDVTAPPEGAEDIPAAAVTVPQLERIVRKIAVLTGDADTARDADALATRFDGPALGLRRSNYRIRGTIPEYAAPPAIPASPLSYNVPQQSNTWPRVVLTVIQNQDDPTLAPMTLVMTQKTPRDNYLVEYAIPLEADAQMPEVAPASIGAPIVNPDSKLLSLPPNQVASAYGDILMQGEASPFFPLFQAEGDTLRAQVGLEGKNLRRAALPATANIEFANTVGSGATIALATNDSGAIVAVNLDETETVRPNDGGTVGPEGAAKALSGVDKTAKGVTTSYGDQLLFYVPAAGSNDKIVLLGWAQGLISSSEVP
ncbi:hypothetical protein [Luethyella okanaganae]|uniref:DUF8094 domain-containing protein n=1 Tax=Luethyella okanaganae TaxID=69372 RepID=A0ABW1VEI8_9MICO